MTQLPLDILAQDAIAALTKNHAQCDRTLRMWRINSAIAQAETETTILGLRVRQVWINSKALPCSSSLLLLSCENLLEQEWNRQLKPWRLKSNDYAS
ncbi:MAG: hypothetical protein KME06_11005 [Kastovskya adunca ATA6-11-RM4]|jgi:hypothetical protein|nr:hypothetical protein [Kastovskya adunca ATA6-11-RM4]